MILLRKILIRAFYGLALFFVCNFFYGEYFYKSDIQKFSPLEPHIDSALNVGDIIYMGESSNTSFNPWTDTLNYSISDFLQMYLPDKKITAITHASFHPGLFLEMLNLLPEDCSDKTLILTVNMRTCGPSAIFSANEASNRQEALFYSRRLPLLTRIFLSLHYYDNRNEKERERLKFKFWRTRNINPNKENTIPDNVKIWLDAVASSNRSDTWKHVADAYIKEFGFVIDQSNDRVGDLDRIVNICKEKNMDLIFHILPENRDYAQLLFGPVLVKMMDKNVEFLEKRYRKMGVVVINNYRISKGVEYTDQWYPTEHMNALLRDSIAQSLASKIAGASNLPVLHNEANNFPNWDIHQPMADTMLRANYYWKFNK